MTDDDALHSREATDHFFGSPYERGSSHPDARPVEAYYCDSCGVLTPNDPEAEPIQMCDVCGELRTRRT